MESDSKISSYILSGFCESNEKMIPWNVHKNHVTFVGACTFTKTAKERREKISAGKGNGTV